MVTLTNHVIDRAGFTWRGAPSALGDFRKTFLPNIGKTPHPKKVLPSEHGAPGTVHYDQSDPGYSITFIKRLDEGLR